MKTITRRQALIGAMGSAGGLRVAAPPVIETHVHLFDPGRVPYASGAPYQPAAYTLEAHLKLVQAAGLTHSVIVHPEPYQNDHRYLEYCFAHEPGPGYFKGTCLFDPFRDDTPARVRALACSATRWRITASSRSGSTSCWPSLPKPTGARSAAETRRGSFSPEAGRQPCRRPADARCEVLGARKPCAILRGSRAARCLRSEARPFCLPPVRAARC